MAHCEVVHISNLQITINNLTEEEVFYVIKRDETVSHCWTRPDTSFFIKDCAAIFSTTHVLSSRNTFSLLQYLLHGNTISFV